MPHPTHSDDDPLAFTAVPTAARKDGWTLERQRAFIAALAEHGGITAAAVSVGMTPQSANRLRRRADAADFARAWTLARESGREAMLVEALRIAREGESVPVFYAGRIIGERRRFDNRLLFAACYGTPMGRFGG